MFRFFNILILYCVLCFTNAYAYQFDKIEKLITSIETHYISELDYTNLLNISARLLNQYDNSLKLYNSETKAYLYKDNHLISEFCIPASSEGASWNTLLTDIFDVAINTSGEIYDNFDKLENELLQNITKKLDKYSRFENKQIISNEKLLSFKIVDNILYIESSEFFLGFTDKVKNIIDNNDSVDGVILDLRKNRGGYFAEAIKTADLFLEDAIITFSINQQNKKQYYTAKKGDILQGKPIAVLTSENTASSAEVVVAALSEQGRATTVGTNTYGKSSMQFTTEIDDKILFLTNGQFYSPSGKSIENMGITPQICNGIDNSCNISDKNNPNKDILLAINLIKNNLG